MDKIAQMKANFCEKIMNMNEQEYYEFWDMISETLEYNKKLNKFSECMFFCPDCKEKYGECNSESPCYQRFLNYCKEGN